MPEIHWGLEQIMDRLAEEVGMDPAQFRYINCVRTDDDIVSGMKMTPIDLEACIDKVTKAIGCGIPVPTTHICSISVLPHINNSICEGEIYFPLSVLNWSFTRPTILKKPS